MSSTTAEQVEAHLRRRAEVVKHLARLGDLRLAWDAWEVDRMLPPSERTLTTPPEGNRATIETLHLALLCELHDLDGAAARDGERAAPVRA